MNRPTTPGNLTRVGSGAPSAGLGQTGDIYIDELTGRHWEKIGSSWGLMFQPTLPAGKITGQVVDSQIQDVSASKILGTVSNAQIANGAVDNAKIANGAVDGPKIAASLKPSGTAAAATEALRALGATASTAAAGNDARLSDARAPTVGHDAAAFGTSFPTTGLFNGYHFILIANPPYGNQDSADVVINVAVPCIYRADVDPTYPWLVMGGVEFKVRFSGSWASDALNPYAYIYAPRNGLYVAGMDATGVSGGGGGIGFGIYQSAVSNWELYDQTGQNIWAGWSRRTIMRAMTGGTQYVQAGLQSTSVATATYEGSLYLRPYRLI